MKKVIIETNHNRKFSVDLDEVAKDRAKFYVKRDVDTSFEDELKFCLQDTTEAFDWLFNNMNWWECETLREIPIIPEQPSELKTEDYWIEDFPEVTQ